jgi:hypothetical protein
MKPAHIPPIWYGGVILLLVMVIFLTGCTQSSSPSTTLTTTPTTAGQNTQVPATAASMITVSLPYGVVISYPNDWERQDALTSGVRDYGKDTINIANFYSPNEIPGDSLSYNSLSIDLDQNVPDDFEQYFNQATLAIGKTYNPQMEAHSYSVKISGYDSYELDFQTHEVKGTYIFTKTDGSMYIFAFKGPNKPVAVSKLSDVKIDIYKSIQLNPPVTNLPKTR